MMRIHNSSSDVILESKVSDKDIIFKVNDGGSSTEVARFDGDVSALLMASGKERLDLLTQAKRFQVTAQT